MAGVRRRPRAATTVKTPPRSSEKADRSRLSPPCSPMPYARAASTESPPVKPVMTMTKRL